MSDIDGMDAYDRLLDRLLEATAKESTQRVRAERAESEIRTVQADLKRVQQSKDLYAKQSGATLSVHQVLKDVQKYFSDLGINKPADWADNGALMSRLNRAVTDTDEIPF